MRRARIADEVADAFEASALSSARDEDDNEQDERTARAPRRWSRRVRGEHEASAPLPLGLIGKASATAPTPARLVALPIADVRRLEDVFACSALSARVSARSCLASQRAEAARARGEQARGNPDAGGARPRFACRDCAEGRAVAAQLGEKVT